MSGNKENIPQSVESEFANSPLDLFNELLEARLLRLPADTYRGFAAVFHKVLNQNAKFHAISFNGPYAKTAHLLRENEADDNLSWNVNNLRVRIRQFGNGELNFTSSADLSTFLDVDFSIICHFIALIYHCDVPMQCAQRCVDLPKKTPRSISNKHWECLRLVVDDFDERLIFGHIDGFDSPMKVDYSRCVFKGCSWGYIHNFLKSGTQLNLVNPTVKDDIIYPELLILEPDILVNISDIAQCFQPYAHDSLLHIINRLRRDETTEAILLGQFAGQLLDEAIHHPQEGSYADSAMQFFKRNAFRMLSTTTSRTFHENARSQSQNIRKALSELPKAVNGYDRSKVILEPSFFSQMLGLQGRVDMMQLDFRFIIEQKSGKAKFERGVFNTEKPSPKEDHMVQMLLYMMIFRYNFNKQYHDNGNGIANFLLYSKYTQSLCAIEWIPDLMFEAIKFRNEIAARELLLAERGYGVLNELSTDYFRQKSVPDNLWDKYSYPQLSGVLNPVHSADPLAKAYFHAMLQFVTKEHLLARVGSNRHEHYGLASIWLNSLDVKRQAGDIYDALTVQSPDASHKGEVSEVILTYQERPDNVMSNFRIGDIVMLYPYDVDSYPDACRSFVLRCTIAEITSCSIRLKLRAPQADSRFFVLSEDKLWAIEHDFFDSSFAAQYRGVHSLLTTTSHRRQLLLCERSPECDESIKLKGEYGVFNSLIHRAKRAKDIFLIIGPPGTGKTSFGMLYCLKEHLLEKDSSILVTAYTNRAVDEICSKLMENGIDFLRIGSDLAVSEAYRQHMIDEMVKRSQKLDQLRDTICNSRVIVGTTTAFCSNPAIFALKRFDLAIVDEASQILEPQLLPILTAMHNTMPAVGKFILIGDHKQLTAVVLQSSADSEVNDPMLRQIGLTDCSRSLFERMLTRYRDCPDVVGMLSRQGRMHRDIAEFPNIAFYDGRLEVVPLPHQTALTDIQKPIYDYDLRWIMASHRVAFFDVEPSIDSSTEKVNVDEAQLIAKMALAVYQLNSDFNPSDSLGIIVPYRNQITTVRKAIDQYGVQPLTQITVDTVERFQGSQRHTIIFGCTVSRYHQLSFLTDNTFVENDIIIDRKLNVAMTRAREHLFIVGNASLLCNAPVYRKLITYLRSRNVFIKSDI